MKVFRFLHLVRPANIYKSSFLKAVAEFQTESRDLDIDGQALERDFSSYVSRVRGWAFGKNLLPGYVPESVYWLVDGKRYIGKVSVRHRLIPHLRKIGGHIGYEIRPSQRRRVYGTMILRLALLKARQLGIKRALVTCDETNIGSRKIIEANGGILENAVAMGRGQPKKLRFWIKNY